MRYFLFVILISAIAISCNSKPKPPENLIGEDTYIDLMIELQLLKVYQANSRADSTRIDSLLQAVFEKYDVTSKQFKSSHAYYQNQLKNQSERIDKAIERLRKDRIREPDSVATDSISVNNKNQAINNK